MIDLCGLVILAFFVLMGARRGALASTLRIVGPLLAYAAAFLGAPLVGPPLAGWLELPRAAGLVLGGALLFVLVLVGFGLADGIIRARLGSRLSAWPRSLPDRLGGGLVGAAHGGLILLLLGLLVSMLDGLRVSGAVDWLAHLPETESSRLVSISQSAVEKIVPAALGESGPAARMTTEFLAHPADTVERYQKVLANPRFEALQRDRLFWSYVEHNALDKALDQGSFLGIADDDTLRTELAELGVVGDDASSDPERFREAAKDVLQEVGPRIRELRHDPAFQQLARDPEVQQAIASGDSIQLFRHPQFRALINRVLTEPQND